MEPLYKQVGTDWQTEELAVFHCDYDGKLPEMNLNMNFILKTLVYRYRASLISDQTSVNILCLRTNVCMSHMYL